MEVSVYLDALYRKATEDRELLERLWATRRNPNPLSAFCEVCREEGFPVYEMDLIEAGESFYAAIRRSTNGGGENSPLLKGEDDFYEMFFAALPQ